LRLTYQIIVLGFGYLAALNFVEIHPLYTNGSGSDSRVSKKIIFKIILVIFFRVAKEMDEITEPRRGGAHSPRACY
jgi:hypothetical protein